MKESEIYKLAWELGFHEKLFKEGEHTRAYFLNLVILQTWIRDHHNRNIEIYMLASGDSSKYYQSLLLLHNEKSKHIIYEWANSAKQPTYEDALCDGVVKALEIIKSHTQKQTHE